VDDVLTLTAARANSRLDGDYCINPKLKRYKVKWAGEIREDGWITTPNDRNIRYHPTPAPEVTSLPQAALSSFTKAKVGTGCHHIIVFEKPQFLEMKTPTENFIEADVSFSDMCGLCGFGATARFRKVDGVWKMTPAGIEVAWVS